LEKITLFLFSFNSFQKKKRKKKEEKNETLTLFTVAGRPPIGIGVVSQPHMVMEVVRPFSAPLCHPRSHLEWLGYPQWASGLAIATH
jgi:hypothetical protein